MKKLYVYPIILCVCTLLFFCKGEDKKAGKAGNGLELQGKHKICYLAVDGKDSALLDLRKGPKGVVNGNLIIRYAKKSALKGRISGGFSGDTLFVNFNYHVGKDSTRFFRNPLAFYKKGDSLILGDAKILTYMGRGYMDKTHPVNFERGRFRFVALECKE